MKEALVLCVISALLPGLHGEISCASCQLGSKTCDLLPCTGDSCIVLQQSSSAVDIVSGTYRGCVKSAQCKALSISLSTSSERHTQISTACCATANCNDDVTINVPPTGNVENGVKCPVCEDQDKPECTENVSLACTGVEEKCIILTGTAYGNAAGNFSLKGCASRNACDLEANDLISYKGGIYTLSTNATCSDRGTLGALSSPAAVFLPAMIGYLVVNILPDL